jgi:hypothetical protein
MTVLTRNIPAGQATLTGGHPVFVSIDEVDIEGIT